jgi:hypothetical protein
MLFSNTAIDYPTKEKINQDRIDICNHLRSPTKQTNRAAQTTPHARYRHSHRILKTIFHPVAAKKAYQAF